MNEWWSLAEALDAIPQLAELGVEYVEQPLPAGDPGRRRAATARSRSRSTSTRTATRSPTSRRVRRDRARDQHQAREVRRDPGGDPDGARGPRSRARRDARLHGRVGTRDRGRLRRRAALRPRRPRRQPAARARIRAPAWRSSTASRCPSDAARARCRMRGERTLILAEGFCGRPALRQDDARRAALPRATTSSRSSTPSARGRPETGVPIVGDVAAALAHAARRSRSSASRPRAAGSRPPGARSCATASRAGLAIENGLHEFLADDPELAAARGRAGVELRDLRRPPADLDCPTGANLELAPATSCSPSARTARSGR